MVYDSRNKLAAYAIENGFDAVLWLDSDMVFPKDTLQQLTKDVKKGGCDIVCGLYFSRKLPDVKPVIYKNAGYVKQDNGLRPMAEAYADYPRDALFEVEACGFGCVLTTVAALKKVQSERGLPFSPMLGFGEDISFCLKARQSGIPIWCDSCVKVGHIGELVFDEELFLGTGG